MEISLKSVSRKRLVIGASAVLCLIYVLLTGSLFVASLFGRIPLRGMPKLANLKRAAFLDPKNADYRNNLGDYYSQIGDVSGAIEPYRAAVQLNPHSARYWFDLASAYMVLGDISNQTRALERAVYADPKRPDVAWEAAITYLVQGDNDNALREFRVVLENDPSKAALAIQDCWRIKPDVDVLLRDAVPPTAPAYIAFLNLLTAPKVYPLSTSTPPSHTGADRWVYTLAAPHADAASNAWVAGSVRLSGYTGDAAGNNLTAMITASTPTTIEIVNPKGTAANTSSDSDPPILTISGTRNELAETAKVWAALIETSPSQTFEPRHAYDYFMYLLDHLDVDQALLVWQNAADRFNLTKYLPTSRNLVVNGNFDLDILNAGFDWQYQKQRSVTLTLDPSEYHGDGHRSLMIAFDGPGVAEAGIRQFIAVQPGTHYNFSAYYKDGEVKKRRETGQDSDGDSEEKADTERNGGFEGDGGPHFTIQDVSTQAVLYESDELKEALGFWKSVNGEFTTGDNCRLLLLRVRRLPEGHPIRGKLWVGDFRLVAKR